MRPAHALLAALLVTTPAAARPTLEETRRAMAIPSTDAVRGQLDGTGYATTAEGLRRVWERSADAPRPAGFGEPRPAPGVMAAMGPHDDYVYAARVYREVFPLVTARTVVLVGVFHRYRKFEARDRLVFDTYRAWRSPEGEIPVSPLRDELVAALPAGMAEKDAASHDSEHSLEGIAYFLRHARPDLEIVPVIVPAASFERLSEMAGALGGALSAAATKRGWEWGRDIAIVISTDGTHYGEDFRYVPYGTGGEAAFARALEHDRALMREVFSGPVAAPKARRFFETVVDPANPDRYRATWCGRFSVTFGTMLVAEVAKASGGPAPRAVPLALGVSTEPPLAGAKEAGIGPTAPANLRHFVTLPAAAFLR